MNARRFLMHVALLAYPRDFRNAYRKQILNDLDEGQASPLSAAMNLLFCGLSLRAELFMRDASYALRRLRKMPLFVCIVALTFALGIGANIAVFSILDAVVLRPLPYPNVSRLVSFHQRNAHTGGVGTSLSIPEVHDFSTQSHTLELIAADTVSGATLTGAGKPKALLGEDVTPAFFAALGIHPQLGRFFTEADERKGVRNIVLSDRLWRTAFNADPSVLSRSLYLDGVAYRIVGVAPDMRVPEAQAGQLMPADYFDVQADTAPANQRGASYLGGIALLRPGVTLEKANAELKLISERWQSQYPDYEKGVVFYVRPLSESIIGGISSALWTVFAAVIGILLVACANVASMLLTNASTRDREFAVRSALGASRNRLGAQLLIETGSLALLGGIVGVGLAYLMLAALRPALSRLPHVDALTIDPLALLYALGTVVLCTIIAGLWPVLALRYGNLHSTLKAAGRSGTAAAGNRMRSALVVGEIAIALALVVLSGLVVRSFYTLVHTDLGVQTRGVLASDPLGLPSHRYGTLDARVAFEQRLLDRLNAIPGVQWAALAITYPLSPTSINFQVGIVGRHFAANEEPALAEDTISPSFFRVLGIPVLRGREFTDSDTSSSRPVAIVNQAFARTYGVNGNAIGMQLRTPGFNGAPRATRTVVGVVGDIRSRLDQPAPPAYYVPVRQSPPDFFSVIVRSASGNAAMLRTPVASAISQVDSLMAPPDTYTYRELVANQSMQARSIAMMLGSLAAIALLLALSGIFGVVAYNVTQRYGEFGLRLALGARTGALMTDVLVRALGITLVGVGIGLVIAVFGARAIEPQLYRISPLDPPTFGVVIALIVLCTCAAALLPAVRAARIDPASALRYE
ncbi:MAG TPA: ABC transporter permease [Candidatus Baltobacteraceae bacterium]|nr:ABC transporter permease [Candidatus Baltobacteraceae bacterium]